MVRPLLELRVGRGWKSQGREVRDQAARRQYLRMAGYGVSKCMLWLVQETCEAWKRYIRVIVEAVKTHSREHGGYPLVETVGDRHFELSKRWKRGYELKIDAAAFRPVR